jgi:hypothetical protein
MARFKLDMTRRQGGFGLLRAGDETLEEHGTDQGATKRTRGALPADRWARVQELSRFETQRFARRANVDEHGAGAQHRRERLIVRRSTPRIGQNSDQCVPVERRPPVDPPNFDGLGDEGVGEDVDAHGDDPRLGAEIHTSPRYQIGSRACGVRVGEVDRRAGRL